MISPAWRCALAAALACFLSSALQATGEPETTPVSRSGYSQADPSDTSKASAPPDSSITPSPTPARPPAPDVDALGRTLGYLTLFAAIAGVTIYFVKFGLPLARKNALAERKLQILETRPLGGRQYLLVVAYDDTRILLGVTPGKIDYICPLDSHSADFGKIMAASEAKPQPS